MIYRHDTWDTSPGGYSSGSVVLTLGHQIARQVAGAWPLPISPAFVDWLANAPIELDRDDATNLADAIAGTLTESADMVHAGHGDTDPTGRAS